MHAGHMCDTPGFRGPEGRSNSKLAVAHGAGTQLHTDVCTAHSVTKRVPCVKVNPELERASAELAGIIADLTGAQADAQERRDAVAAGDGAAPLLLTSAADADATAATPADADAGAPAAATATETHAASPAARAGGAAAGGRESGQGGTVEDEEAEGSELELEVDSGDDDLETSEDEEESGDDGTGGEEDEETQFHLDQVRGCCVVRVFCCVAEALMGCLSR